MDVISRGTKSGFKLKYKRRVHKILYPGKIWEETPKRMKRFVIDNSSFLSTAHIPMMFGQKRFSYSTNTPAFMRYYNKLFMTYLPFVADSDKVPAKDMLRQFRRTKYSFRRSSSVIPEFGPDLKDRSVISFTFGKDSLLTYCVAEELGLDPVPIYVEEPELESQYENRHKRVLIERFEKEFGKKTMSFWNEAGLLRYYSYLKAKKTELGWCQQLTEYLIDLMPICNSLDARFVFFGNEYSCNDFYYNKEGMKCFPVYDQSTEWMLSMNRMMKKIDRRLNVMSLVEPLHEIAITKILHGRYGKHAKYQTSCFADKKKGQDSRWCHYCSKCGRMYTFLKANNIDPRLVGFSKNLFERQFANYYTLFSNGNARDVVPYDESGMGKDEQLFAFYLAYKNGARGYLINRFRKEHYHEARSREDEFHRKFFKVNKPLTITNGLRRKTLSIYREELEN
jgi:hypothetical protein